jgi:uncharacterized membrane protein
MAFQFPSYLKMKNEFWSQLARRVIAVAMIVFGAQHLIYGEFVTRLAPKLPTWVPAPSFFAYLFGACLITAGLAILLEKRGRDAALLLGGVILLSFFVLYLPAVLPNGLNWGIWTNPGKALALAGAAFLVADSFGREGKGMRLARIMEPCIPLGRFFLGAFFMLCGILHVVFADFVKSFVPSWMPLGLVFWTYFSAATLFAGGLGLWIRPTARCAGFLSSLMIFLWVPMVHIPRVWSNLRDANEMTAVFEALAMSAACLLVGLTRKPTSSR